MKRRVGWSQDWIGALLTEIRILDKLRLTRVLLESIFFKVFHSNDNENFMTKKSPETKGDLSKFMSDASSARNWIDSAQFYPSEGTEGPEFKVQVVENIVNTCLKN